MAKQEPVLITVEILSPCIGEHLEDLAVGQVTEVSEEFARFLIWTKKGKAATEEDAKKAKKTGPVDVSGGKGK